MKIYTLDINVLNPIPQVVFMQQNAIGILRIQLTGKEGKEISCFLFNGEQGIQPISTNGKQFDFKLSVGEVAQEFKVMSKVDEMNWMNKVTIRPTTSPQPYAEETIPESSSQPQPTTNTIVIDGIEYALTPCAFGKVPSNEIVLVLKKVK